MWSFLLSFVCVNALPCLPCIALHCLIADCFPSPEMLCINYCHTYRKFISQPNRIRSLHRRNEDAPHVSCLLWMLLYTVRCAVVVFVVLILCFFRSSSSHFVHNFFFGFFVSLFTRIHFSWWFYRQQPLYLFYVCLCACVCVNSMLLFFPSYFRISLVLCVHIMSSFYFTVVVIFPSKSSMFVRFSFFFLQILFYPYCVSLREELSQWLRKSSFLNMKIRTFSPVFVFFIVQMKVTAV